MRYPLLTSLLATFACLSFTNSYGQENLNLTASQILPEQPVIEMMVQKIYVQPSEIYFSNNQIFVQTPKGLMPVNSLQTDAKGIHYRTEHPKSWYCQYEFDDGTICGHYNAYTYYCEHCGHSPEDWRRKRR